MNSNEQNHPAIHSIDELVTSLTEGERTEFADIIYSTNLPLSSFEPFLSWSDDCYTRNCIAENENFELILLCWEKGQSTPIHDHGGEECWVKVIQGEFRETILKVNESGNLRTVKTTTSQPGDISYMVDFMGCHRLENINDGRTMSLHLYANPIRNCQLFDEDTKTFVSKEMSYDTCMGVEEELK